MYRFPKNLDLHDLVGSSLDMVACCRSSIHFSFGSGRSIRAEGRIEVQKDGVAIAIWTDVDQWTSVAFQPLLTAQVTGYKVTNDRLLTINFNDGFNLLLHDDSDQYETILIEPGCIVI
jgi:hypothetical protein